MKGKVKVLKKAILPGKEKKTVSFRQYFSNDGKLIANATGDRLFREQKYHSALQQYRAATRFSPELADAFFRQGHALVATKQFEQKACPFSGGDVNPDTAVKLAGVSVGFCCNNCKGKVEGAEDDAAKLKLVFTNKAFEKGFKKKADDEG